jgi:muramoyltetrapeptide carboxypeptidase
MTDKLIIPPALQQGDRVVIVSPAGKIDHSFLIGARKRLASWGLNAKLSTYAASAHGWYSSSKRHRLADLQRAMDDEEVKAIFCSRGGYGAVQLIEGLDFTRFSEHPKWLIGFSDITALHNLFQSKGFASLHAPMARHLTVEPADDLATGYLHDILFGQELPQYRISSNKLNRYGKAEGILRGGNLAVLYGLRGTPYDIPPDDTILFLEDTGERPHSIERMFYNLKLGGVLERLSGLIIGQFTEFEENLSLGKELYAALAELLKGYDYPVCFDFPVGHVTRNFPLINGARVSMNVVRKMSTLDFL